MYIGDEYTQFSLTDVRRFERWLCKWCSQECTHGRSMIVFDNDTLKVEGTRTIEVIENQVFHHLILPNITLRYIFISQNMCVLTKVWENITLSVLYNIPERWHNVEVWPAS